MLPFDAFNRTQIARVATGLYNIQVGQVTMDWALGALESGDYGSVAQLADLVYQRDFGHVSNEAVASRLVHNLGITGAQATADAMTVIIRTLDASPPAFKGSAVLDMLNMFAEMTNALGYSVQATNFNVNVAAAVQYSKSYPEDVLIVSGNTFTLTEPPVIPGENGTPPVTAVYWGYTPTQGNGGATDGDGIPVGELLSFLTTITGLDLAELGLIDDDGVGPFDNVTNLSLSMGALAAGTVDDDSTGVNVAGNGTLNITFLDGTSFNAEVRLGEAYFQFLNNLLFDADGNSRLYEKVIEEGTSGTYDQYPAVKLTPSANNGGTIEPGVTTAGNDTIVAGRLELLHGAYIDGGLGYNILEVDAKGVFAQPLQLLNIQEVRVANLPNVYTYSEAVGQYGEDSYYVSSDYPYWDDTAGTGQYPNSMLDLSRATSIERLVITEGSFEGFLYEGLPGSLTIAGIRNGAVARLEGGFTQDVNLHWGQGQTGPLTVELLLGQITGNLNFVHNNDSLHLVSLGGGSNSFGSEDIGGRLTQLQISGDAALYINGDLDNSFQDATPITIDASENTGGVNLELSDSQNVTFIGSQGNDIFIVDTDDSSEWPHNDESVTIIGGAGNNRYEVESYRVDITNGDGNNNYEVDAIVVNITAGNGNNHFEVEASSGTLVAGDGNNRFEIQSVNSGDTTDPEDALDYPSNISITTGDGKNQIQIEVDEWIGVANIVAGDGGNTIDALGHEVNITTGTSKDVIKVLADKMVINSGGGGDTITIGGWDYDFVSSGSGEDSESGGDGAFFQIDTGSGASTIILGNADDYNEFAYNTFPFASSITAHPDSFIRGENVTLFVNTVADLRAAELTGVTRVIMDDDRYDISKAPKANDNAVGDAALLTLTAAQFAAIGAANFSVQGSIFNTHAYVKIIVTESTSLTALGVDSLPRGIDLFLELADGVTLTMTAQQLHMRVAQDGITIADDGNTDQVSGKVVITGGGLNFDPFNTSDTIKTNIEGTVYVGGSLSDDFMVNGKWFNVTVRSLVNGWDRPADAPVEIVLTLDSTGTEPLEQGAFSTWHNNFEIIGNQDIVFTGAITLGADFTVDFSSLDGEVINLTLANFQDVKELRGNGLSGYDAVVYVEMTGALVSGQGTTPVVGSDTDGDGEYAGLVSSGVRKIIVTNISDGDASQFDPEAATIYLCDQTLDLEVIGLRGNYNATLNVYQVAWGTAFELQGDGTVMEPRKVDGPTGESNVGVLNAMFQWPGAAAVVNINNQGTDLTTRKLHVEGINIDNAKSIALNVEDGDVIIDTLSGDKVKTLTITAEQDVTIVGELPSTLTKIDASGVVGELDVTVDPADDFSFIGSEGGSSLTFSGNFEANDDPQIAGDHTTIDGGVGGVVITIGEDYDVDLTEAVLINVTGVVLEDDSTLSLTMAQAAAIGAGNISIATGDTASLVLEGLDGEPFALDDFADGITVTVVNIANLPVVTLHPDTDLTGIGSLSVPAGTVLNLTAAQYQQLTGAGTITGIGGTTNFTVNITDLTQADAEFDDSNIPGGTEGLDLSGVTARNVTITMAESIELVAGDDLGDFDVVIGDGMTLTLADIQQADGLNISGGTNTTLKFTDTAAGMFESIDASGFDVTTLMMLNVLVANRNVDLIFLGLAQSVTKVIYNGNGWVEGITQIVFIEAGTTVPGFVVFNKPEDDVEIQHFVLNLTGGTEINGNLRLSNSQNLDSNGNDLIQTHLKTVTINSTGTAPNLLTGETANVIDGNITPLGTGLQGIYTSVDNNLLALTINADQDFILEGKVVFESVVGDDTVTANDDDEAVASLVVNGAADVTLGGLDTSDEDVVGLNVVNNGTGTLSITLDGADIDTSDDLSFTGTGDITLTVKGTVDLTGDILTAVTQITIDGNSTLTITHDQFLALGAANILPDSNPLTTGNLNIVGLGSDPFNASGVPAGINVNVVTLVSGNVTLDPTTNLTGVDQIVVPEGSTLTLTAAQYQQLLGSGSIVGVKANGDPSTDYTVNITGLTQADVDRNLGAAAFTGAEDGFDLSGVTADDITITLGESTVTLGKMVNGALVADSESVLNGASFILADNQTLQLVNSLQADGLDVSGGTNTTLVFLFAGFPVFPAQIDASGYDVTVLKALAASFIIGGPSNVEYSIDDLRSSVELRLYQTPEDMGFLDPTFRRVVIEEGITTPTGLIFNDWDAGDEVRTLDLTLEGGVTLNGNLSIPTRTDKVGGVQRFFDTLTINSVGDEPNLIDGNVNTVTVLGAPNTSVNNLLKVVINAPQDIEINGDIVFASVDVPLNNAVASLTTTGAGDITIQQLITTDDDIGTLAIAANGTGTLSVTGASAGFVGGISTEKLILTGSGDIVFGTNPDVTTETGVDASALSLIDASGLTGDLDLGKVINVDSADFTFTAGTGVTKMTLMSDTLDSTSGTPGDTTDDTAGWTLDFSDAAAGSQLHLGTGLTIVPGSVLNIDLGANTTLYIDASMDLSDVDLSITQTLNIVLADGATLTLNAAQASTLNIVAGPDTGTAGITAKVNVVDLGNTAVDLSGIAANIAGNVTLEDNDVTLAAATNLGAFTVVLQDLFGDSSSLVGQTIRFQNVAQAERDILVIPDINAQGDSSANVVWYFTTIAAPVDTSGYDAALGRLWFTSTLVDNQGGLVESLFTTLPSTILRVDFATVAALNILLASNDVHRILELVNFTAIGNLTFSDVGATPEEHIENLTLELGGQVVAGNILIDDVVAAPNIDLTTIDFDTLTINSRRALHQDHILASEFYVNNNDGTNTTGETVQPANLNTVGNVGVGANNGLDLLTVTLNTFGLSVVGNSSLGDGANLNVGTITYGTNTVGSTATLNVDGVNNVNITSVNTSDVDITALVVSLVDLPADLDGLGFTGTLTAPGASPGFWLNNTQSLTFTNGNALTGTIMLGSATNAGVAGNELSIIDASDFDGTLNLGTIAQIDSTNDDSTPLTPANDGLLAAFTFTSGSGVTTITLATANGLTPTLNTGSEWIFDYTDAAAGSSLTITSSVVFQPGAILTLIGVPLVIEGNVDLSQVVLNLSGTTTIVVPAGQTLTVTAEQLEEVDMVDITGAGTVKVVGDASNLTLGAHLKTVGVDISGVTLIASPTTGFDVDDTVKLVLTGADDDSDGGTVDVGQVVIGSPNMDNITTANGVDNTITGGALDDTLTGGTGDNTYNVDAGTDTIVGLKTGDVLVVSAGATAIAGVTGALPLPAVGFGFVATAATVNNGTVVLTGGAADDTTIDVSLAGGTKGFTLIGGSDDAAGLDELIGSNQADIINGGNNNQAAGSKDTLTGNGGADIFQFNVNTSVPAVFSKATQLPLPIDRELITVPLVGGLDDDGGDTGSETITIAYAVNGIAQAPLLIPAANFVSTSEPSILSAIATALDGVPLVSATVSLGTVIVSGDNGNGVEITSVTGTGSGWGTGGAFDIAEGVDVAQNDRLDLANTAITGGELYSFTTTLATGTVYGANYIASPGDTNQQVVQGLVALFNGGGEVSAMADNSSGEWGITFTDLDADNGGFTLASNADGAYGGSGASDLGATTLASADLITDFVSGTDKIQLGLVAGTGTTYKEAGSFADFATARAAAIAEFDGTVRYFLTSSTADNVGLLFFDANADGLVDGVIALTGISDVNFGASDIIA
ncbi:MAG: hypothetical protein IH627_14600 [Rubrivivax sp.]|nr:hypothetical protein [Rubrivivax sp.]